MIPLIVLHKFVDPLLHFSRCSDHLFFRCSLMVLLISSLSRLMLGSDGLLLLNSFLSYIFSAASLGMLCMTLGILPFGINFFDALFMIFLNNFSPLIGQSGGVRLENFSSV